MAKNLLKPLTGGGSPTMAPPPAPEAPQIDPIQAERLRKQKALGRQSTILSSQKSLITEDKL